MHQTYGRYELGNAEPTIETLCKLADYYGVSLDYLVGRDNSKNETEKQLKKIENLAKNVFENLSDENKMKVYGYILGIFENQN